MHSNARKPMLTLHVVTSLDGFIAGRDESYAWLDLPNDAYEAGVPEESAQGTVGAVDCYVLGSRTYETALRLGWPYGQTPVVVVTSRKLPATRSSVEFWSGDLRKLVEESLAPRFGNVWLVGGANLCQGFLALDLVDEIRLSIAPVLLGQGLRLFGDAGEEKRWRLKDVVAYKTGIVELAYGRDATGS